MASDGGDADEAVAGDQLGQFGLTATERAGRPAGTGDLDEAELATLVTRNGLIGVAPS